MSPMEVPSGATAPVAAEPGRRLVAVSSDPRAQREQPRGSLACVLAWTAILAAVTACWIALWSLLL